MRPTPGELADGIRILLRSAGAEVQHEGAKAQVRRIMHVLKGARWDDAAFDLLHENALLRDALRGVSWGETIAEPLLPRTFGEANAINRSLRAALTSSLEAMRTRPLAESAQVRRALASAFLERP